MAEPAVSQLLALGIHPKKSLGQNFLVDAVHRARIVAAAELTRDDTVLEVGPGPGVLTELIATEAGRVVAVELDDRLIPILRARFALQPHVTIVHGDILRWILGIGYRVSDGNANTQYPIPNTSYKVIANFPYYITSAVIRHLLESAPPPERLVLTVQREVAERMVAAPPDMSLLALGVQFYCAARIVEKIPAGTFYPVPKVDSAVVRLDRRAEPLGAGGDRGGVFPGCQGGIQPAAQAVAQLAGVGAGDRAGSGRTAARRRMDCPAASRRDVDAGRMGRARRRSRERLRRILSEQADQRCDAKTRDDHP